jgi:hypothetical protein
LSFAAARDPAAAFGFDERDQFGVVKKTKLRGTDPVRTCDNVASEHDDGTDGELVDMEALFGFDQRLGH